jgi:glyoxylase-like metal-dependent hydrolase (beta-lactamase superfamily II)
MTQALLHGIEPLHDFDAARQAGGAGSGGHGRRLRAVRLAAERVRDRFASGPRVVSVRTMNQTTAPYPTKYAFFGAAVSPAPFVSLTHRCTLVQFLQGGALKNLLFNPTDVDAARTTPYFARLLEQFKHVPESWLATRYEDVEVQLARWGITPADIDYVAFDHFHIQDLRSLLGTTDDTRSPRAPRFPHATLLAPRAEWEDWDDLHPLQQAFFIRDGKKGVREDRVALTTGDLLLGDGLMLVRTPGHTCGNQTLFLNTDSGVWGISENGTCVDNWSPLESSIKGLAATCRKQDLDIILNSNTPEAAADQYTSMVLERTIVDRVKRAPAFVQMFSSSEVTPTLIAPALTPTVLHVAITSGDIAKPSQRTTSTGGLSAGGAGGGGAWRPSCNSQ